MKFKAADLGRALMVLGSALFLCTTDLSAQLSVDRLEVFIDPASARTRTGVVHVTNSTDNPVQAVLEVQDWNRDETGSHNFHKLGSLSGTCGDDVKVFPASVRIGANTTQPIRVSFEGRTSASCWAIIFIQGIEPPNAARSQSQITYVIRTGVKVYVQAASALRQGDVDCVRFIRMPLSATDTTTVPALEVLFRNTGRAHVKPAGAIEVSSPDNNVVTKLDITEFPIAPGDTRRIKVAVPAIGAGRYIARALLHYGGAEMAAAEIEFEVR